MQARYYAGPQGRFTSVDPLLASGIVTNPKTWNRYAYALNNPLRFTDPTGLSPQDQDTFKIERPCEMGTAGCNPVNMGSITVTGTVEPFYIETESTTVFPNLPDTIQPATTQPITAQGVVSDIWEHTAYGMASKILTPILDTVNGKLGLPTSADCTCQSDEPLNLFHGSDAASIDDIVANGLNIERAVSLGGGDVFWTTSNLEDARFFAEANPAGGTPAILRMQVPRATANALLNQGTLIIDGPVHQFSRPAWPQLNKSATFTKVP